MVSQNFFSHFIPFQCTVKEGTYNGKSQADLFFSFQPDWALADLFSAGSLWLGLVSIMQPGGAGLLPWGGTAAGLQSAYHGHRMPSLPSLQTEGKLYPLQSRDKPLSCWENQIQSPPKKEKEKESWMSLRSHIAYILPLITKWLPLQIHD